MSFEVDLLHGLRGLLAIMMLAVTISLGYRWFRLRRAIPASLKYMISGVICLLLAGVGNQAKFMREEEPPSIMTWLSLLALVFLVVAQLEPMNSVVKRYAAAGIQKREDEIQDLKIERSELADRLYDAVRNENERSLEVIELKRQLSVAQGERV